MMYEEIEKYYSQTLDDLSKKWVNENLEKLDEEQKQNFMTKIASEQKRLKGLPDIATMNKVYASVTGNKKVQYFWCVCSECGTEFEYQIGLCPACYKRGYECRMYSVKVSEFKPPMKVIKFNKHSLTEEISCMKCLNNEHSYCEHFGAIGWYCKDFRECSCAGCCTRTRKRNEEIEKEQQGKINFSYARRIGGKNDL